jgi:hypothetical protein
MFLRVLREYGCRCSDGRPLLKPVVVHLLCGSHSPMVALQSIRDATLQLRGPESSTAMVMIIEDTAFDTGTTNIRSANKR